MGYGMSRDELQDALDRQFPSGTHVWMKYGTGSVPFAFLIPRVFVLDDHEILLSEFRGDPLYFVIEPDEVTVEAEQVVLTQGTRTVRLSSATPVAQEDLKAGVEEQFKKGRLELLRKESPTMPEEPNGPEPDKQTAGPEGPAADVTPEAPVDAPGSDTPDTSTSTSEEPTAAPAGPELAVTGDVTTPSEEETQKKANK